MRALTSKTREMPIADVATEISFDAQAQAYFAHNPFAASGASDGLDSVKNNLVSTAASGAPMRKIANATTVQRHSRSKGRRKNSTQHPILSRHRHSEWDDEGKPTMLLERPRPNFFVPARKGPECFNQSWSIATQKCSERAAPPRLQVRVLLKQLFCQQKIQCSAPS